MNYPNDRTTIKNTVDDALSGSEEAVKDTAKGVAGAVGNAAESIEDGVKATIEKGKQVCCAIKDGAISGAKRVDSSVHAHPYVAIAIGAGVAAAMTMIFRRRCNRHNQ